VLSEYPVHALLPSQDLDRAKTFYSEKLGLTPDEENPAALSYRCGEGTRFVVFRSSGKPSGDHTQAAFTVDDIEKVVEELRGRGVEFEEYEDPKTVNGIADLGALKVAYFHDSEGNLLGVVQFQQA
jgi:catechol 2,3-dioxygenase-like lactoylglutathione lyase family enzyme